MPKDLAAVPGRIIGAGAVPGRWMYVDGWYLLGPFDNAGRANIDKQFPPETVVDLNATYVGKRGRPVRWEFHQSPQPRVAPPFDDFNPLPGGVADGGAGAFKARDLEYIIYYGFTELRAAETGRAVLHSAVSGETAVIDDRGTLHARTKLFHNSTVSASVTARGGQTLYVRFGEWVLQLCVLTLLGLVAVALRRRQREDDRARGDDRTIAVPAPVRAAALCRADLGPLCARGRCRIDAGSARADPVRARGGRLAHRSGAATASAGSDAPGDGAVRALGR